MLTFSPFDSARSIILPATSTVFTKPISFIGLLCIVTLLSACNANLPVKPSDENTADTSPTTENSRRLGVNDLKQSNKSKAKNSSSIITSNTANFDLRSDDLWQRIRDGYQLSSDLPDIANDRIKGYLERYSKHPKDIYQQTERAGLYLYHVTNELDKKGMPLELALLPFVESRYDPFAYSSGRASGLWQFIPGTGKHFKLHENWWLDERRDIIESTAAAIRYLQYLHGHFDNDWLLAIAAYNAGEGTVGRAIRKNRAQGKATDYWSLPLPKETQFYIPKLIAWASIVKNPSQYQLSLAPAENTPQFDSIDIGSQIDLAKLADISDVDINTIYALNPAYNRWATDPDSPHELLLPIGTITDTAQRLKSYPLNQRVEWQRYTVKKNDSLSVIAGQFNTSVKSIKSINKLKGNTIRIGKTLLIPTSSKKDQYHSQSVNPKLANRLQEAQKSKQQTFYIVKTGDSLWSIARQYQVNTSDIARWNNISTKDILRNKQKLLILTTQKKTSNESISGREVVRKVLYPVKNGDNLSSIAEKFNVSVNNIREWNTLNKKYLQPGEQLTLFVSTEDQAKRF